MLVLSMLGTADSGIIKTSIFLNNSQLGTQERKKNVNKMRLCFKLTLYGLEVWQEDCYGLILSPTQIHMLKS